MTKLWAPVPMATWPVFALALLLCLAYSSRSFAELFKRGPRIEDRTDADWKALGTAALEELQKKDLNERVPSDAKRWLEQLGDISPETDCTDKLVADLIKWRITDEKFRKFVSIMNEYFELYLIRCGLEDQFKAAIEKLKQVAPKDWSSSKYKTLRKYLKSRDWTVAEGKKLFSIIKDFDSHREKTDCTDEYMTTVVGGQISGRSGEFRKFFEGHGGLYLEKCGFEEQYTRAIAALKQVSLDSRYLLRYETMHELIKTFNWREVETKKLVSIVNAILDIESTPQGTDCTSEHKTNQLIEWLVGPYDDFRLYLSDYAKLYFAKCGLEDRFKKAIDGLKQVNSKYWDADEFKTTLHDIIKDKIWARDKLKGLLSIVKDISRLDSVPSETDCTDEYMIAVVMKQALNIYNFLGQSTRFMSVLCNDYGQLYSEKCGFEERFKRAIANVERVSAKRWNTIKYSTLFGYLIIGEQNHWNRIEAKNLLATIRAISEPDSGITGEKIDCTEKHVTEVAEWFVKSTNYPELYDFLTGYYAFYLKECGFEEKFQKAIDYSKKFFPQHLEPIKCSTLSSCFTDRYIDPNEVYPLLSSLGGIPDPYDAAGEIDCSDEQATRILTYFFKSTNHDDLRKLADGYFAFYLDKCGFEDQFIVVTSNIESFSPESKKFSKRKLYSYFLQRQGTVEKVKGSISIIRELAELGDISQEADCTDKLESDLLVLLDKSKPYPVERNLVLAYFARFLYKCGYEQSYHRMKRWYKPDGNPSAFPTLMGYFDKYNYMNASARHNVLSLVKELSLFDNFNKETHCNDEMLNKLLDWNAKNDVIDFHQILAKDHFEMYLKECGFENMYANSPTSKHRTLFNSLWAKRWQESWREQVMSTIKELNFLQDIAKKADCPRELVDKLLELHAKSKQDNPDLYTIVRATLNLYKDKCDLTDLDLTV